MSSGRAAAIVRAARLTGLAALVMLLPAVAGVSRAATVPSARPQSPDSAARARNPTAGIELGEQELHEAPAARDVWALLEHRIPVVVSQRLDVGGSATGRQGLFSARSTSWNQNVFRLEGVEMTDPAVRGTSGFYYDYGAFEEVTVSWGTQPAGVAAAGVLVDIALRRGGDEVHGAAQGYFENSALQADNLSPELEAGGVERRDEIDYLSDLSLQLGGPLVRERAWVFGSYRDWRISRTVPGFDAPVRTDLPVFTIKGTGEAGPSDDVHVFWSRQSYRNPARGADRFVAASATSVEDSTFNVLGGRWQHRFTSLAGLELLEVRGSILDIDFPLLFQEGANRQSRLDLVSRLRSGSASLATVSSRRRYSVDAEVVAHAGGATGEHWIRGGVQYQYAPTSTSFRAIGDVNIITSGGAPFLAQLLNTPVLKEQNARGLGLFAHDDISIGDRWMLSVGVRYDDWTGSLAEQSSPPGTFAPARRFAAQDGVVGWRGVAPRATVAADLFGDGRSTLIVGFSQYVHQLGTSTISFGNPNALGVEVVPWSDANGDGQFQPGEGGAVLTVGGAAIGQVDPGLSAPLTRELRAGVDYRFDSAWRGAVDLWYRKDSRLFDDVEVGLTADDFAQTTVRDPGPDNMPGTGDDSGLNVFNQISGFGNNRLLLTTAPEKTVTYRGMDFTLERAAADRWQVQAVLSFALAEGIGGKSGLVPGDSGGTSDLFNDPNALINADGRTFWDRTVVLKLFASYRLPHGVTIAGVSRVWSGTPLARILPVPLNQGLVDVFAAPRGSSREDTLATVDLRVAKTFELEGAKQVGLYFDLFNATNASTVTRTRDTFPFFGSPATVVPPLVVRLGARFGF